tara:strand:+ start:3119 stop:3685 length:567 start_codon:yes stop_codon:yes gene_type:complete
MNGDFSFMQTGLGSGVEAKPDVDTIRMIVSLLSVLMEEAVHSAARLAKTGGQDSVSGRDMVAALKYEAHFFWQKDIDARFVERLREERTHTYETDDDSEGDGVTDQSEEAPRVLAAACGDGAVATDNGRPASPDALRDADEAAFHVEVMRICEEWSTWNPTDPAKRLLKNAIDKTERDLLHKEEDTTV